MKTILIASLSTLMLIGASKMTYAATDNTAQQIQQLNSQIQVQLQKLQADQQKQLMTLNAQLQVQMKQVQAAIQAQIQKMNTQTQDQMKKLQATLEQEIKTVQKQSVQVAPH